MGSKLASNHFHLLFNFSQNVCHLADRGKVAALTAIIRPLWEGHTNLPFECPFEPVGMSNFEIRKKRPSQQQPSTW